MSSELQIIEMAESQCRTGLDPLVSFLQGARQSPVQIRAQAVENLGALRLQALLSARDKWRDEGIELLISAEK